MADTDDILAEISTLTLDLRSVTLGEMAGIEIASGRVYDHLIRSQAGRVLIALYLREWRSSGHEPQWSSLSNRRPLANASSTSRSASAGRRQKSSD